MRGEREQTARASSNDPGYETIPNGIYYSSSNSRNRPASQPSKAGMKEVRSSVKGMT